MTSADWYYALPRTLDNIHRVASLTRDRLSLEAWRTLNDFYASRRWRADAMPTAMGDCAASARRRPARAGGLPRPHAREHDAQLRLVVPRHGAAPRRAPTTSPRRCSASSARPGAATTRRAACCSPWSSPTASSPIARATGWRRCCRWCSTCCCSTRAIRAASPSSSPPCRATSIRCPSRARAAAATRSSAWRCRCCRRCGSPTWPRSTSPRPTARAPGSAEAARASRSAAAARILSDVIGRRYFNLTEKDAKRCVYARATMSSRRSL